MNEFTLTEFSALLSSHFQRTNYYGHWLTHEGKLRKLRAKQLFEQLCDTYYHPASRAWRSIKRMTGKKTAPPPRHHIEANSFTGDYVIYPLEPQRIPWPATTLIAVCEKQDTK